MKSFHTFEWYTLATGTWPGEHRSTNNTFHRTGEGRFNNRTPISPPIQGWIVFTSGGSLTCSMLMV